MRNFTTRKPTGKPSFPMVLLAGIEGSGKTWSAVEATASPDVGRAFFIEIGESMADEYGAVPGADFEIIEHDGTIQQIREAVAWASQQPVEDGKYNLLIMDSMSEVWTLLSDNAQEEANRRARRKKRQVPEDGVQITMDLWNRATEVWNGLISQCRNFPGPVLMTARLEMVTLMDGNGQPSKDKDWKVKSQKNLPYNVQVVMQAREPRRWTMTKVATTAESLQLPPGKDRTMPNFTVTSLLEKMGITPDSDQTTYVKPQTDDSLGEETAPRQQAPPQQQRPYWWTAKDQRDRKKYVADFADSLMKAEQDGDTAKINQMGGYVDKHSDSQLVDMAMQTLERMSRNAAQHPTPADAQETVQEVLDAEVVAEDRVAA